MLLRIKLEQRSSGLQYFFSFYLVFLVESGDAYHDSILLLGRPGLGLVRIHDKMQLNSLNVFITRPNLLLSPFRSSSISITWTDRSKSMKARTVPQRYQYLNSHNSVIGSLKVSWHRKFLEILGRGNQLIVEDTVNLAVQAMILH